MTDPKLAAIRASRKATGQTDNFAAIRATYEDATEEELFSRSHPRPRSFRDLVYAAAVAAGSQRALARAVQPRWDEIATKRGKRCTVESAITGVNVYLRGGPMTADYLEALLDVAGVRVVGPEPTTAVA